MTNTEAEAFCGEVMDRLVGSMALYVAPGPGQIRVLTQRGFDSGRDARLRVASTLRAEFAHVGVPRANLLVVEVDFMERADGGIDARVVGSESMFNEVFGDSINALAPAGAVDPTAPSTYWIDRARAYALAANEDPSANPIAHGNVTIVTVEDGSVVARFDFDPDNEPGESIPLSQFIELLDRWRELLLDRCPSAAENYPGAGRVWSVGSNTPPSATDP